jgi:hypothetical protein
MNRTELQDNAWTFPNATIGGRPCKLSPARLSLLRRFKNPLITGEADFAAHPGAADEMAFVLSAPREQVKALAAMTHDQRAEAVMNFGLDFEDEIIGALAAINRQMQSAEASAVEAVEAPGKSPETARPAPDGSRQSIGSQSETD